MRKIFKILQEQVFQTHLTAKSGLTVKAAEFHLPEAPHQ